MIVQLIYVSVPSTDNQLVLEDFLAGAQYRNKHRGISGMFVTTTGLFMQLIEGERLVVNELFQKIVKDSRHSCVTIVRYSEIRAREFAEWPLLHIDFDHVPSHYYDAMVKKCELCQDTVSGVTCLTLMRRLAALHRVGGYEEHIDHIHAQTFSDLVAEAATIELAKHVTL